jgi:DnaJ-class molecular chaperone
MANEAHSVIVQCPGCFATGRSMGKKCGRCGGTGKLRIVAQPNGRYATEKIQ